MFGLFQKKRQKTDLEIATENLLKGIDSVEAAMENRNAVFMDVKAEMQKNLDILQSIGVEVVR